MKWTSTEYTERLNIANGLITAIVNWNSVKNNYSLTVNYKTFPLFNTREEAKKVAENYIRDALNMAIKEVNL